MIGELTPNDPVADRNEYLCDHCQTIVPIESRRETCEGNYGCTECTSHCQLCGELYYTDQMYDCPFYGLSCDDCRGNPEHQKDLRDTVLKEALRCYFDTIDHPRVERTIVKVARFLEYSKLAQEMQNDLKQ